MHEGPATAAGELKASTPAQIKKSSLLKAWPNYAKIEKTLGGLKFAVSLILLFSLAMTIGTFLESYYGTDFASRLVYKRWPFMLVQFLMLISIIFAVFLRLPPKKRLYGFIPSTPALLPFGLAPLSLGTQAWMAPSSSFPTSQRAQ